MKPIINQILAFSCIVLGAYVSIRINSCWPFVFGLLAGAYIQQEDEQ